ncbi:DUF4252 domain-containing protein [Flavobacterium sp. SM15]|uniref:DUF4252 domain-containing protein n=1 Tax=Flavobacterium sp. SM15 TaxID=2908005 RepID=UPI001EDADF66|nr:DUF4252 domain-containing protein [Flavobacterium sp. SM15]MCG2610465.1 DUF4252 domain-containing protein [Flavobacterium sp. SM15]
MKKILFITAFAALFLTGCEQKPTLQKYFVEKSESKGFTVLDVSPTILNLEKTKLSSDEKQVLDAFEKVNILTLKADGTNQNEIQAEKEKIKTILNDKKYESLIKVNFGKDGAEFKCVGQDEHIDEFVLYGSKKENGLAVVRITGEDMNPTAVLKMLQLIQKSNVDVEQLKPLQELFK